MIKQCIVCSKNFESKSPLYKCCSKECTKIKNKRYDKIWSQVISAKKRKIKSAFILKRVKELGIKNNIECISTEYINSYTKLKWKCKNNHEWFAAEGTIKSGSGCPHCSDTRLKISDAQKLADLLGFKCISEEYINSYTKLVWQCKEKHIWRATYSQLLNNHSGCPECNIKRNKSETRCREIFESYFNKEFKMIWPDWLIGPKGWPLQLDGYNEELKLAFEYNGKQHYEPTIFLKDLEAIKYQRECDALKVKTCKEKGIKLIVIPYKIRTSKIKEYIIEQIIKSLQNPNI